MLVHLFALTMAFAANAKEQFGHDEFGRRCALRLEPRVAVMVEDEWFVAKTGVVPESGRTGMTVYSKADGKSAELEIDLRHGHGAYFTLQIQSATGYAHGCLLELQ